LISTPGLLKQSSALDHPLPQTRARICWLIGKKKIPQATEKLKLMSQVDPDRFVQRAAVEALGHLAAPEARQFLTFLLQQDDPWLRGTIQKSLNRLERNDRTIAPP